jgi:WD40 repeat protein
LSGPFRKLVTTLGIVLCLGLALLEKYSASKELGPDSSAESGFSATSGAEPPGLVSSPQDGGHQESDALVAKLEHAKRRLQDVAFSPDGKLLAAGYGFHDDGGVTLWSVADRKVVASLLDAKDGEEGIARVAFSPDGKWFAAATGDGDVMLWATGSWRAHKTVIEERGSPNALSFSPQSDRLAFSSDETVVLYDLQSGRAQVLAETKEMYDTFQDVSFSPDGKLVAVYGRDTFQFRDVKTGELIKTLKTGGLGFFGRLLPDGRRLIAGGGAVYGEKSVEIWDVKDEKRVRALTEFRGGLFSLAVSHSGKLFAVAGGNYGSGGNLSLWDLEEGRELGFASFGGMPIEGVAFSPDDRLLAAASEGGFVLLYAVDRLRGPQLKRQTTALCGEVAVEEGRTFIVPLSKGPGPMVKGFGYAWKIEVANAEILADAAGAPVVLNDWTIESSAARARDRKSVV